MKKLLFASILLWVSVTAIAQPVDTTANRIRVRTAPSGACTAGQVAQTAAGEIYSCISGTWGLSGSVSITDATATVKGKATLGQTAVVATASLGTCAAGNVGQIKRVTDGNKGTRVCTNTTGSTYAWVDPDPVFNVVNFGVDLADNGTDDTSAVLAAVTAAVAAGGRVYIPAGTVNVSPYFPVRQSGTPVSLQDYNNIIIYGDGRTSIIKSSATDGADPLQLNGVKNVAFRDLAITGVKTNGASTVQGINGVSITGGGQNIKLERIHAFDLEWEDKSTYVDGGKAFTIQPSTSSLVTDNIQIIGCSSASSSGTSYNAFGFGIDLDGPTALTNPPTRIRVEGCVFEAWYQGLYVSVSANGGSNTFVPNLSITLENNTVTGAQYGAYLVRPSGVQLTNNKFISTGTGTPSTIAWDTLRIPIVSVGAYHSKHEGNFVYYAASDHYARIGGITHGTDGNTYYSSFVSNNFTGASAGDGFDLQNSGGYVVKRSKIVGNSFTGASGTLYDPLLRYTASLNTVETTDTGTALNALYVATTGGAPTGAEAIVNGSWGIAYTDGYTAYNFLKRSGVSTAVQQTASSSASAESFVVLNNAGTVKYAVRNDGGLKLHSSIYDENNAVWLQRTVPSSSVNYFEMAASTTGNPVAINAKGTDTNITMTLAGKGTGAVRFLSPLNFTSLAFSTTAPTVTSAGTSPSIVANNGTAAFTVNVGTGGTATTIVLAMPTATTGWICHATNVTATAANRADQAVRLTASTTTSVTLQNQTVSTGAALAFTASDVVHCQCTAY